MPQKSCSVFLSTPGGTWHLCDLWPLLVLLTVIMSLRWRLLACSVLSSLHLFLSFLVGIYLQENSYRLSVCQLDICMNVICISINLCTYYEIINFNLFRSQSIHHDCMFWCSNCTKWGQCCLLQVVSSDLCLSLWPLTFACHFEYHLSTLDPEMAHQLFSLWNSSVEKNESEGWHTPQWCVNTVSPQSLVSSNKTCIITTIRV